MFVALLLAWVCADPTTLTGKVVGVTDGDTITVLIGPKETIKVRLVEIDAPESKQPFGTQAKLALSERVFGKEVQVETSSKDRYGRTLGTILLKGENVNLWLVKEGWAWQYLDYSKSPELREAQEMAKAARKGLWFDPHAIPPWEWRKKAKEKKSVKPAA